MLHVFKNPRDPLPRGQGFSQDSLPSRMVGPLEVSQGEWYTPRYEVLYTTEPPREWFAPAFLAAVSQPDDEAIWQLVTREHPEAEVYSFPFLEPIFADLLLGEAANFAASGLSNPKPNGAPAATVRRPFTSPQPTALFDATRHGVLTCRYEQLRHPVGAHWTGAAVPIHPRAVRVASRACALFTQWAAPVLKPAEARASGQAQRPPPLAPSVGGGSLDMLHAYNVHYDTESDAEGVSPDGLDPTYPGPYRPHRPLLPERTGHSPRFL